MSRVVRRNVILVVRCCTIYTHLQYNVLWLQLTFNFQLSEVNDNNIPTSVKKTTCTLSFITNICCNIHTWNYYISMPHTCRHTHTEDMALLNKCDISCQLNIPLQCAELWYHYIRWSHIHGHMCRLKGNIHYVRQIVQNIQTKCVKNRGYQITSCVSKAT